MNLPFQIDLNGKVAVVTGAGGIICGNFAKALAQCGAIDVKGTGLLTTIFDIRSS